MANWIFKISTGELFLSSSPSTVATGLYSGKGEGKNNPDLESVHNVGPIPEGWYTIGTPFSSSTHGPFCLPLIPDVTNEMYGRTGFLCHGDSREHPGEASEGCIIAPREIRETISQGSPRLQVIA